MGLFLFERMLCQQNLDLVSFKSLRFSFENPPNPITFFLVKDSIILNLFIPR